MTVYGIVSSSKEMPQKLWTVLYFAFSIQYFEDFQ